AEAIVVAIEQSQEKVARAFQSNTSGPIFSETDVHARAARGRTLLMDAAELGMRKYAHTLIADGAEIDLQDDDGATPLILASAANHYETVEELLNAGAKVDIAAKDGSTALSQAAWHGYMKILRLLLTHRAGVEPLVGPQKLTPLMGAATSGNIEV